MTSPDLEVAPAPLAVPEMRAPDLVLAGLHLRLGSLALARAELETIASQGGLDRAGRVDLAEVRWRTGDLFGAGDAAREALAGGDEAVVALVVAAEAAAALGRPTEARRLAGQALARADGPIDPIFAGMPRSGVWPADPAEPVPSPTTLFPPDRAETGQRAPAAAMVADSTHAGVHPGGDGSRTPGPAVMAVTAPSETALSPAEPGFWDIPPTDPSASPDVGPAQDPGIAGQAAPPPGLEPAAILDAGEAALAAGDYASAALHLGLAVRVAPSIAPVILEAIGDTPDAGLQMVRGDAYRAVGRETDARRAYEAAMAAAGSAMIIERRRTPRPEPGAQPVPGIPMPPDGADDLAPADIDDDSDPFAGEP